MPRAPTYAQARDHLLTALQLQNWEVRRTDVRGKTLKVPYASKGRARVYFKTQSIHVDCGPPFSLNAARSTHDDPRELAELVGDDSIVGKKMSDTLEVWCLRDNPSTEKRFTFTDKSGKQYTWTWGELADTLFESAAWDKSAVRKKAQALKVGSKMTVGGETLKREENPIEGMPGAYCATIPDGDFEPVVIGVTPTGVRWVAYSPDKVESMRKSFKRMEKHQAEAIYLNILGTTWQVLEDIAGGKPSLAGRASHLKSLRLKGLVRKNARGKWELTRKGKQVLRLARSENPIEGMPGGSVTGCIAENQDKDDPGAYCAAIADRIEPGWRGKARKNNPSSASDLVRKLRF